jgi:predicted dienelactone hydrolase
MKSAPTLLTLLARIAAALASPGTPANLRRLRVVAIAVASAVLLIHAAARAETPPAATAPTAPATSLETADVISLDLDWEDSARNRAVPVRLYLPEGASAAHPVPLVVFSHGMGGSRRGYSYLGRYWASQGYASLHLQHVGSDRSLWSGNVFSVVGRLQGAAQDEEAIARAGDFRFALDQLLANRELGAKIDATRIVAAGHSYGANTTLMVVGAKVERNGRVIDLSDPRPRAAIILSAPPFYGENDTAKILAGIKVPTLHITATEDVIRIPGYYSGAEDRIAVFEAMPGTAKFLAVFEGGSHSMFTDRAGTGGATLNPQVKAATRELGLAFMKSVFEREDSALHAWPGRFAALLARFTAGRR